MDGRERRQGDDRRQASRGGRRDFDKPGRYPPVIIADSDSGARQPCARYLERFGFQVEQAASGEDAVSIVDNCPLQVAIAELTLPRDDDFQTRVWRRGIPYVAIASTELYMAPVESAAVLVKPFSLATLLTEVRRVLTSSDRAARGVIGPAWLRGQA
jgi:DNA-binding response OmpR family regulator